MTIREWHERIGGATDAELGQPRHGPLVLHGAAPASGRANGLVFVIPDLAEDIDGERMADFRRHLAAAQGLLAISLEYHAYRGRLADGAQIDVDEAEFKELRNICATHAVALLRREGILQAIGQLPGNFEFELAFRPASGDYQNLGVIAALDHLVALKHLATTQAFDPANILLVGNAYGGHLAHLVAKIAPRQIRAVIDFSGWVESPAAYLFGSQEKGPAPYYYPAGQSRIRPLLHTRWNLDPASPAYFSPARRALRDTGRGDHARILRAVAGPDRPVYCALVAILDTSPFATAKLRQMQVLQEAGLNVLMKDVGELDGASAAIEQTANGAAISLRFLFDSFYPLLGAPPALGPLDYDIAYPCGSLDYRYTHSDGDCQVSISPREAREEVLPAGVPRKPLRFY